VGKGPDRKEERGRGKERKYSEVQTPSRRHRRDPGNGRGVEKFPEEAQGRGEAKVRTGSTGWAREKGNWEEQWEDGRKNEGRARHKNKSKGLAACTIRIVENERNSTKAASPDRVKTRGGVTKGGGATSKGGARLRDTKRLGDKRGRSRGLTRSKSRGGARSKSGGGAGSKSRRRGAGSKRRDRARIGGGT
jgi:hypothetical protein